MSNLGSIFGIKRTFNNIYRFYLWYQPTSLYRLEIDERETLFNDARYGKNYRFQMLYQYPQELACQFCSTWMLTKMIQKYTTDIVLFC